MEITKLMPRKNQVAATVSEVDYSIPKYPILKINQWGDKDGELDSAMNLLKMSVQGGKNTGAKT